MKKRIILILCSLLTLCTVMVSYTNGSVVDMDTFKNDTVAKELYPVEYDGKWGYVDAAGENAIKPQFWEARDFVNGLAVVVNFDKDRKYGCINSEGKYVIPAIYDMAYNCSENRIVTVNYTTNESNAHTNILDTANEKVASFDIWLYDDMYAFSHYPYTYKDNYVLLRSYNGKEFKLANLTGESKTIKSNFENGVNYIGKGLYVYSPDGYKIICCDVDGKTLIEFQDAMFSYLTSGAISFQDNILVVPRYYKKEGFIVSIYNEKFEQVGNIKGEGYYLWHNKDMVATYRYDSKIKAGVTTIYNTKGEKMFSLEGNRSTRSLVSAGDFIFAMGEINDKGNVDYYVYDLKGNEVYHSYLIPDKYYFRLADWEYNIGLVNNRYYRMTDGQGNLVYAKFENNTFVPVIQVYQQ